MGAGRGGGGNWPTAGSDPQRTSWVRTDAKISKDTLQKPGFQLLWKSKLDNQAKQLHSLTQPLLLQNIISYKGFKALAFVGGSADNVYSIDYDLNKMFWKTHLSSRRDDGRHAGLPGGADDDHPWRGASAAAAGRPRRARRGPRTGRTRTGRTGTGRHQHRGRKSCGAGGAWRQRQAAAPGGARGGSPGTLPPGAGAPAPTPPAAAPAGQAPPPPAAGRGGGGGGGGFGGGNNNVYAISSGGMVHVLNVQTGEDLNPPIKFLPSGAKAVGSMLAGQTLYAATTDNCGGAANGVYALDLASDAKTVSSWDAKGAAIAGTLAPAFGADGTIFVATGAGSGDYANAVVGLDGTGLTAKDWFSAGASPFVSSPVVFQFEGKDVVAAANKDGRLYLLDSTSLGGADHKTPLARSPQYAASSDFTPGALTTWQDADGTRWIAVPAERGARRRREVRDDQRRGHERRDRHLQGDRHRHADPRTGLGVARPAVAGHAAGDERRDVRRRGRRRRRHAADPGAAGRALETGGALRARRGDRQGTVDQRHVDHVPGVRRRPVGRRQPGLRGHARRHGLRLRHADGEMSSAASSPASSCQLQGQCSARAWKLEAGQRAKRSRKPEAGSWKLYRKVRT